MKLMVLTLLLAFASSSVIAADNVQSMSPQQQEMMKKFKEYSTPGAPHKILESMVGKWNYTSKMWMAPDAKPDESKGTTTMTMILGGRFLENISKGTAMGMPFEGKGQTGYDNLKKKYETTWIDNFATGTMHGEGTFDESTKTLTDSGTYSCPMTDNKVRTYRATWKLENKNNIVYTMYGPDEKGHEFTQMEMILKRAKR